MSSRLKILDRRTRQRQIKTPRPLVASPRPFLRGPGRGAGNVRPPLQCRESPRADGPRPPEQDHGRGDDPERSSPINAHAERHTPRATSGDLLATRTAGRASLPVPGIGRRKDWRCWRSLHWLTIKPDCRAEVGRRRPRANPVERPPHIGAPTPRRMADRESVLDRQHIGGPRTPCRAVLPNAIDLGDC